ncbi:NepR family anti-sigma factor [Solirhodobacter olei]|uniref:NepR family anti-sigma factor n=1 Tax=Solirhodobacter olei TaxID=2493082 RepID=UPI001F4D6DB1|nr:NepR family anti-sigma factor [Solirhodobacter olei]
MVTSAAKLFSGTKRWPAAFGSVHDAQWAEKSEMRVKMSKEPERSNLRRQIDENLKRAYEKELERDVPDRFRQLLEELRQKEATK